MTEDATVGWHHQFDGHEFEQALGIGDGEQSLVCCSPRGHKESNMTERLNGIDPNSTIASETRLSITNSRSPLKPMSIESLMPSNHLILCRPPFLLRSISPSVSVFSNESVL